MKKNFFKKLSFVMALAMIISVIAPAAGAFAATGLKLNATSKTLFLGENNAYNFNVLGKSTGSTEKWTSSKTSVATVNAKNGVVTAKAVGTTTITATVTNAKKTVTKKLTAKVTVGDNVKTLKVVAPADADKLAVGTDYTFSATYVTKGGSKTKTSNSIVWSVDKEGATIKNGVFTATEPGEYTVTATATRYKNVKVTSDSVKVTVLNAIKEVKQTTTNTFTVEFAGKVADLSATTASVAQVVNGKDVTTGAEKIKSVTLDSTGKIATVVLYADFVAKSTYKFVYGTLNGTFVAASKDAKDVAGIVFDDFSVNTTTVTGTDLLDYVYAVNKDGVKILNGSDLSAYLTFEVTGDQTKGYVDTTARKAYIYTAGNTVSVKATFTNYVMNDTTKAYETVTLSDTAVGTGVSADVNTSTMQYAVATSEPTTSSSAWTSAISVAVADSSLNIYTRYKHTTDLSTTAYTVATTEFTYVSSDPSKLSINASTLYPIAAGTVTVIVKNADATKVLGSFDVVINAERVLTTATPDVPSVTVGNNHSYAETKAITISTIDNLGKGMKANEISESTPSLVSKPSNAVTVPTFVVAEGTDSTPSQGQVIVKIKAADCVAGFYQYKIVISDTTNAGATISKEVVFGIYVAESNTAVGNANVAVNYVAVFEKAGDPIAKTGAEYMATTNADSYGIVVYGVNASGYRVSQLTYGTDYNTEVKLGAVVITTSTSLTTATIDGSNVVRINPTGTYNLTVTSVSGGAANRATGSVLSVASFNVTNSYTKSINVNSYAVSQSSYSNVRAVLNQVLSMSVGDTNINLNTIAAGDIDIRGINSTSAIQPIAITDSVTAGTNLYIDTIKVRLSIGGAIKEFSFDVKQSIAIK